MTSNVEFVLPKSRHIQTPVSPLFSKSEGSSPAIDGHHKLFRFQQNPESSRSPSSLGASLTPGNSMREETPMLLEKGFNYLVSAISDRVEASYLKVKSTSNLSREDEFIPCTPPPATKKERSLSVNSYLLSPSQPVTSPTVYPKNVSLNTSPRESPRNLSLPANRLFFFPPNFQTENLIPSSRKASSETSRAASRKASDNSDASKTPLSSRAPSPTPPSLSLYSMHHSRSPSPCCVSPLTPWHGSTYSTPLPRRNLNKIITKDSSERIRKFSICEGDDSEELMALFGLDPRLYGLKEKEEKFPENHLGYDKVSESLALRILNIKNIPRNNKDIGMIYKTYISISLIPDERSERRAYQTSNTFSDHNPNFNETFFFQVSPQDMDERILKLKIFNIDVNRKHRIIGQVLCSLKDLDWEKNSKIDMGVDISKYTRNSLGDQGSELLLSVCYNPNISRLTLNVLEAKNLRCSKQSSEDSLPDSYVRVSLNLHTKVVKVKKTSTIKSESCPRFSQSFHFKVEESLMDITSLCVTVLESKSLLEKDKVIGSCNLGGSMFARGKGEEHWKQVLKYSKQHVEMWHPLVNTRSDRTSDKGSNSKQDSTSASF